MQPAEAALLAGIPEDPSLYDPVAHPRGGEGAAQPRAVQLWQQHYLTRGQYRASLHFKMPNPHDVSLPSSVSAQAPYFANYVRDQLVQQFGPRKAFSGGLHVKTTIDLGLQKIARDAAQSVLPNPDGPAAALVTIRADGPDAGAVLAMVGGRNYHQSQFNLATQGERQPGSAFKPFVLATALKQHIAPSSVFKSKPVTINADGKLWPVNNYEGEYLGPITLATGIAVSDNAVYSQLTALVGPKNVAAHRARARHHDAAAGLLLDRARRRVDDAARHGARLCVVRRRRPPHRRLDVRQRPARRRVPLGHARATARPTTGRRTTRCSRRSRTRC